MSKVVAKKWLPNQTAALGHTDLFTSSEGGDYRISAYLAVDDTSGSSVAFIFGWVDEYRDEFGLVSGAAVTANPASYKASDVSIVVHVKPNSTIYLDESGTPTTPKYSLYVTIEELSGPQF